MIVGQIAIGVMLLLARGPADTGDELDVARRQFELHNYKVALDGLERCLSGDVAAPELLEVEAMRAQCLLKLRRLEEGIAAMEAVFADHPSARQRPGLHVVLAEAALRSRRHRHLAIRHYETASDLYQAVGDRESAADAAVACAGAFISFNDWEKLAEHLGIEPPADWRAGRRLQQRFAVQWFDRGIRLTSVDAKAAAATYRKATLLQRGLGVDGDIGRVLEMYRELVRKWPATKEAPQADMEVGRILERHGQDYVGAVEQYQRVTLRYPGTNTARRAEQSMQRITAPVIRLGIEGVALPGENARIDLDVRNVGKLRFKAFRVDLFRLIREIGHFGKLDEWTSEKAPAAEWTVDIPDTGEHKRYSSREERIEPTRLPISDPGAYVIVAEADAVASTGRQPRQWPLAGQQTRTSALLLVSRLAAVSKGGKDGAFVWAVDSLTGQPADAPVLVQERLARGTYAYYEGRTDEMGMYTVPVRRSEQGGGAAAVYLRRGADFAICNASFSWYWWGHPNDFRLYAFTDRPVYRPDQQVHFKLIVRRYDDGEYDNVVHKRVDLTLHDPQGEVVESRSLTTNARGTVSGDFNLAHGLQPVGLGIYRMEVEIDGRRVYPGRGGIFRVEEYRKPEFEVTVEGYEKGFSHQRYAFGGPVDVRIEARYYFGSPVAGASVSYTVHRTPLLPPIRYPGPFPWYFDQLGGWWLQHAATRMPAFCRAPWMQTRSLIERGELTTGADGTAILRFTPAHGLQPVGLGYRYIIDVEVTDPARRTVTGSGSVNVTRAPFTIRLQPQRYLYQPGDTVQINVEAFGPNEEGVAFEGRMRVYRLVKRETLKPDGTRQAILEPAELVAEKSLSAGARKDSRTSEARFRWTAEDEGRFRFVVTAVAEGGTHGLQSVGFAVEEVSGECDVWIAKRGGRYGHYAYRDVELVLDKYVYEVGDTARVLVNTRFEDAHVLLTVEADELLDWRILDLHGGGTVVELPVERMHQPNFYLAATVVHDNKVYQDMQAVVVPPTDRFLTVGIEEGTEGKEGTEARRHEGTEGGTFLPGQEARFVVTTMDADGAPVDADVALMMVDASLYYIQKDFREQIQEYFYGKIRPHTVRTQTSFDVASFGWRRIGPGFASVGGSLFFADTLAPSTMMAKTSRMLPDGGGKAPEFATAKIRREFPDSVLWVGHLDTGADGRASVDLTFPDSLTTWRLIAIAVDDETRVGETSRDFVTRKDVIARLNTPRFLVERDRCQVTVIARNDLDTAKTVRVSLDAFGPVTVGQAERDGEVLEYVTAHTVELTLASGSEAAIDFDVTATGMGTATFTATVATDVLADAMERSLPVRTFGSPKLLVQSGVIRDDATVGSAVRTTSLASETIHFTLPQQMDPNTPILEVHLNPTIAGVMLDAVPYLLDYPYGCTEQTMSRFLPAVMARSTLERLGVKLSELASRARENASSDGAPPLRWNRHPVFNDAVLNDIVSVGLARLTEMQNGDGGWGWWQGGASDPYMTAYVVYGLAEAGRCKVKFDRSMLERGTAFLKRSIVDPARNPRIRIRGLPGGSGRRWMDDANVRAWMLYALSVDDRSHLVRTEVQRAIDAVFENRDGLTDYTRAMLAMVLQAAGDSVRAGIVIDNLYNTVDVDQATQTVHWGRSSGYYRWFDNGLESTAMVLRALLAIRPDHPYVVGAVNWLVRSRQGARWHSTKDTAFAVYALANYLETSEELDADMTVTVTYDDKVKRSFHISPENVLTFDTRMIFAPRHLTPGEHSIHIERRGRGNLYYSTYVDFYTQEDPIEAAGADVLVQRRYVRLIEKEVERTRRVWDSRVRKYVEQSYRAIDYDREPIADGEVVRSGDLVEVTLEITAHSAFEYILMEDPKPAGCEPVELHSGYDYRGGVFSNIELRDEHVAFFASYLPVGQHTTTYRLRCETPGVFAALPTRLEAMYSPYVRANSASHRLAIAP
ncbi:MAG: alpha-2-macroglobulin family protein [Phycisphaerae bacterium]